MARWNCNTEGAAKVYVAASIVISPCSKKIQGPNLDYQDTKHTLFIGFDTQDSLALT